MLTQTEKYGCQDILRKLTTDDIRALTETITRRPIIIYNRNVAEEDILRYTEKAVDFLRRKRVKRDVLFDYLAASQVVVPVTADKKALIRTILQRWESGDAELADDPDPSQEEIDALLQEVKSLINEVTHGKKRELTLAPQLPIGINGNTH